LKQPAADLIIKPRTELDSGLVEIFRNPHTSRERGKGVEATTRRHTHAHTRTQRRWQYAATAEAGDGRRAEINNTPRQRPFGRLRCHHSPTHSRHRV